MSKNPREELDEVFIKSQRLAHFSDAGSSARYLNRNVAELNEATKIMAESMEQSTSRSLRTLASEDLSAKNILSQVNSIRLKSKAEPARLETTSMEGYLAHHRDMIVLTAIEESRRRSDEYLEASRRRWNAREWESAKTTFMESLGHRAQSWAKFPSHSQTGNNQPIGSSGNVNRGLPRNISSDVPPVFVEHSNAVREINLADSSYSEKEKVAACEAFIAKAELLAPEEGFMSENDIAGYKMTLDMMRSMVGEDSISHGKACLPGKFAAICFEGHTVDMEDQAFLHSTLRRGSKRYLEEKALTQWTRMVGQVSISGRNTDFAGEPRTPGRNKEAQVRSYVQYLAQSNALPAASTASSMSASRGGSTYGGSLSGSFSMNSPHPNNGNRSTLPLWPFVYHCLRSGQIRVALEELQEQGANATNQQNDLIQNVQAVIQIMSSATNAAEVEMSDSLSGRLRRPGMARDMSTMIESRDIKAILLRLQEHYRVKLHAATTVNNGQQIDTFLLAVLNLVSGANRAAFTGLQSPYLPAQFDLYDLLWTNMWYIELDAAIQTQYQPGLFSAEFGGSTRSLRRSLFFDNASTIMQASSQTNTKQGEEEFLELVYNLADENFFDRQDLRAASVDVMYRQNISAHFRYVLALFSCHRFGDAIQHLWTKGQIFAAVHLTVLSLHYGLILPHQPLIANPLLPLVQHHFSNHVASIANLTPMTVLQLYVSHPYFKNDVYLVTDYLVTLNLSAVYSLNNANIVDSTVKDVMKFQAQEKAGDLLENYLMSLDDMDSVVALVGQGKLVAANRMPSKQAGRLFDYFTEVVVQDHVVRIADKFRRNRDARRAIDFYLLAGNVKEVMIEFCQLLTMHWAKVDDTYASYYHASVGVSTSHHVLSSSSALGIRTYWRESAQRFVSTYDSVLTSGNNNVMTQEITEYQNFLKQLLRLYDAVDELLLRQNPMDALKIVDEQRILPSPQLSQSLAPNRLVQMIIDDLILFVAQCVVTSYQQLQRQVQARALGSVLASASSSNSSSNSLTLYSGTDMDALKLRWKLLMDYTRDAKRMLQNPQTVLDVVQLDTSFKW